LLDVLIHNFKEFSLRHVVRKLSEKLFCVGNLLRDAGLKMVLESKLKSKQAFAVSVVSEILVILLRLIDTLCKVGDLGEKLFGST